MEKVIDSRFELTDEQPLDTMSMFQVYRAHDLKLGGNVVVKMLKEEYAGDANIVNRFMEYYQNFQQKIRNTKNLAKVTHLSGMVGGRVYMVQEYVQGETLEAFVQRTGTLTAEEFLPLFKQICEGLHSLHFRKMYHYKLLPKNILISPDNGVKLISFGSLYAIVDNKELIGRIDDTIKPYLAPEIFKYTQDAPPDGACDIYALGKIIQTLEKTAGLKVSQSILEKALDADPLKRYSTIREFEDTADSLFDKAPVDQQQKGDPVLQTPPVAPSENKNSAGAESEQMTLGQQQAKINKLFHFVIPGNLINEPVKSVECSKKPQYAYFKEKELIFRWTPDKEDIGTHAVEFILKGAKQVVRVILPIEVPKPGVVGTQSAPKEEKVIAHPLPEKNSAKSPEWKMETSVLGKPGETVHFNVNNSSPDQFAIKLVIAPPGMKKIQFDETSGELRWKPGKKDSGVYKFVFERTDLENNTEPERRFVKVEIENTVQCRNTIVQIIMWPYNLIVMIGGLIGVIFLVSDMVIGFLSLGAVECIYLVICCMNQGVAAKIVKSSMNAGNKQ